MKPLAGPLGSAGHGAPRADEASEMERHLRTVLGHFATGVAVVTALDGDEPVGLACNSFTSVSLDPPLVLFCIDRRSGTWPRMRAAGHFAVNFLSADAQETCRRFAAPGADRFAHTQWRSCTTGAPVLDEALAFLDCLIEDEHEGGDHLIVVGRVVELGTGDDRGGPLVFYRGGYGRFAS